jgi:hypothetical protein
MNDWGGIDRVVDENPHWQKNQPSIFCGFLPESLVMLVNESVRSTEKAVQKCRANYFIWKLRAGDYVPESL